MNHQMWVKIKQIRTASYDCAISQRDASNLPVKSGFQQEDPSHAWQQVLDLGDGFSAHRRCLIS